jgi:UDP-glucose 4-epimerase
MRALVTGGSGFIGSNLVDALLDRGDEVTVVDDLSTGRIENLDAARRRGIAFHEADITDGERLCKLVASARPDIVFHLAAQIDVRKSIEDPAWDAGINVGGTINVLDAARRAGVARVVNTSTGGAIYGDVDTIPTPESTPPRPMAAYGTSKLCAETYCGWHERLYGLSAVTLRYGNVYGPRQDPLGEAGVIAIFCGRIMAGRPLTVFGDGSQTRDYVHVADVADAIFRVSTGSLPAAAGVDDRAFNVGTGIATSVNDLARTLLDVAGATTQIEYAPARPGELQDSCLAVDKARTALGWTPKMSLAEGLADTYRWSLSLTGQKTTVKT